MSRAVGWDGVVVGGGGGGRTMSLQQRQRQADDKWQLGLPGERVHVWGHGTLLWSLEDWQFLAQKRDHKDWLAAAVAEAGVSSQHQEQKQLPCTSSDASRKQGSRQSLAPVEEACGWSHASALPSDPAVGPWLQQ